MPTIIVVDPTSEVRRQTAACGVSLMEALRDLGAVDAICGGGASCGTCAVRVAAPWYQHLPAPDAAERVLLAGFEYNSEGSRLSCQILVDETMHGMTVHLITAT
jgi:ferredoxin, 2Fe-2S